MDRGSYFIGNSQLDEKKQQNSRWVQSWNVQQLPSCAPIFAVFCLFGWSDYFDLSAMLSV
ncbi:MAG: hypothetical protein HY537_10275 [Deltaproteobacteria bacterium]|nr:hypothetical protein [Deltaproteobacteria bacterium]